MQLACNKEKRAAVENMDIWFGDIAEEGWGVHSPNDAAKKQYGSEPSWDLKQGARAQPNGQ